MKACFASFIALVGLTACGQNLSISGSGGPNLSSLNDSELAFYESGVFETLSANCSTCHGSIQAPLFAISDDIALSHNNAIVSGVVDLQDPRSSRMVLRVYQGHNCWTSECRDDGDLLLSQLEVWAERSGSDEDNQGPTGIVSEKIVLPSTLADIGTIETLSIDLDNLVSDLNTETRLEIQVERFDAEAYRFFRPRIFLNEKIVLQEVSIFMNNKIVSAQNFEEIDEVLETNNVEITRPGGGVISALVPVGSNAAQGANSGPGFDEFQITLRALGPFSAVIAQKFNIMKEMIEANCMSCHNTGRSTGFGGGITAFTNLDTQADFINYTYGSIPGFDGAGYMGARRLVVPGDALRSGLYRSLAHTVDGNGALQEYAAGGVATDGTMAVFNDAAWAQSVREWIDLLEAD